MEIPEDYAKGAEMVGAIVGTFAKAEKPPRFRFPPREICVAIGLDRVAAKICVNGASVACLASIIMEAERQGWPAPTLLMLQAACSVHKLEHDTISLSELGFEVPTS